MQIASTRIKQTPRPSARPAAEAEPAPEKEWTLLFYNAGYNDEAKMCTYSLDQLERVGSDENTNLVVMNHRRRWVGDRLLGRFGEDDGTKTHYVVRSETEPVSKLVNALPEDARVLTGVFTTSPKEIRSPVIDSHPENPNMGDPATLKRFLLENMKRYPAKHYAVVLSGHGAAFQGQMIVHQPEGRISNEALGQVFEDVAAQTGRKIDLLNMNTCYSANMETVYPLRNAAGAMVASENTVFAGTQPLAEGVADLQQALREGHQVEGKDLAGLFVERARRQPVGNLFTPTLSALDPGQFENLAESVKVLQDTLMSQGVDPKILKECMEKSVRFDYSSVPRDIFVTDLGSFARNVQERVDDEKVRKAAKGVLQGLSSCVLDEQHAEHHKESLTTRGLRLMLGPEQDLSGATGLTIYYDHDVNNDSRLHKIEGGEYADRNNPGEFLRYVSRATEEERASQPALKRKFNQVASDYSKWKRRTATKIPIPRAMELAQTAVMGAASYGVFSGLSKLGIPAGDVLFGGYFVGLGALGIGKNTAGLVKNLSSPGTNSAKKEEMIEQGAQIAIGACMGTFGLYMLGLAPQAVAWPSCLGALGLRIGKEVAKVRAHRHEFDYARQEAREYAAKPAAKKLELS